MSYRSPANSEYRQAATPDGVTVHFQDLPTTLDKCKILAVLEGRDSDPDEACRNTAKGCIVEPEEIVAGGLEKACQMGCYAAKKCAT